MSGRRPSVAVASGGFPIGVAVAGWLVAWFVGSLAAAGIVQALGTDPGDDPTTVVLAVASAVTWVMYVVMLVVVSRRFGSGDFLDDYVVRWRPIDLVGVPVGVATQLLLVPAIYIPLRAVWPDTFDQDKLDAPARELADRASGASMIVLVLIVVIGAPIIEELVYRGLVARSLMRSITVWPGLVVSAVWFSLVHADPALYPGLFVAGLVFGACVAVTGRIGPAIVTHAAFNAVGLAIAAAG